MDVFYQYLERCGIEFDTAVNVLTGGDLGQTVSYRMAVAAREGRRIGCLFCWFLDWAVQKNHCSLQFDAGPNRPLTFMRAGIAFGVGFLSFIGIGHMGVDLVRAIL